MSHSGEDGWVLDEAEAVLDMDGRRDRLELVVADLQSGKIQPVDCATARDRIEKYIRDRRTP
jgi:ABC-type transport system involved in cytochrome c biogenesis ATPase subunit